MTDDAWTKANIRAYAETRATGAEQSALDTQIGGDHYKKLGIQPMEYSMANNLDACQHTVIKYVTRFRDKGGIVDLEKARHAIDMLIEFERRKTPPVPHDPIVEKTATPADLLVSPADLLVSPADPVDWTLQTR